MDKLIDAAEMIAHQLAARCRRCDVRLVPLREWNYETGRSSWRSYCDQPNSKSARELDHQRDEKAIKELFDAAVAVILREPSRVRQRRVKRSR